ncbi:tyrosine-type recombinase/integrase [Rhizobium sp. OAE497]|uniref:tyrosine-type recombinase/integrase n=1 Tax=Rhizobium sp. OAE497 TaxID=2663796 RepID=UPI00339307FA
MLARLGLRAGDISRMRLDDIDWREATLCVRGKGRGEIRLPLPQEAGDAIIDYLRDARPPADSDCIFLRTIAPFRPLAGASVSGIVSLALTRAGIDAPSRGANLLRHSAATSMLRAGATLDTIGAVLRHRSVDTTAHYAKVDVDMLLEVVQPWPGSVAC